ncbi:MAG: bifunctional DNA-formamidopyrimidine glycosylase/DNA-(apurinic or apyrimidinic site) lyase [Pirellulaceae bacterium]|nr:bifunctional DNA-formamidopyrimidine glycosylase/DNA-(apurinic or apyrimidinic site) lyase [Pirellulaceae bacterium]MDP7014922.1 bifunctional DNA-formamidopyrimidine glycosylase/DNA-(apurinic or apyrimidinic site) lyase [Pirellulaceae bacterium]
MPELPEVETMRRGIACIVGATVTGVQREPCERKAILVRPRIDAFRRRAVGCRVAAVERIGKRVVMRLDSQDAIVFEPRMTGLVLVADPPSIEHLRFRVDLDGAGAVRGSTVRWVWYWDRRGLGSVRLMSPKEIDEHWGPDTLGPDALDITAEQLRESLRGSKRAIKVALLDQRVVAGVGNLYASEILHLAEVHPERRCDQLTRAQWDRVVRAQSKVLEEAIVHEGSTLGDGAYRNVLNDPGGYQNHHKVYDREAEPCPNCSSPIKRIVQAQRSTFFCARCQAKSKR